MDGIDQCLALSKKFMPTAFTKDSKQTINIHNLSKNN